MSFFVVKTLAEFETKFITKFNEYTKSSIIPDFKYPPSRNLPVIKYNNYTNPLNIKKPKIKDTDYPDFNITSVNNIGWGVSPLSAFGGRDVINHQYSTNWREMKKKGQNDIDEDYKLYCEENEAFSMINYLNSLNSSLHLKDIDSHTGNDNNNNLSNSNDNLNNDNLSNSNDNLNNNNLSNSNDNLNNNNLSNCNDNLNTDNLSNSNDNLSNDNLSNCNDNLSNDNLSNSNDNLSNDNLSNCNDNLSNDNLSNSNDNLSNAEIPIKPIFFDAFGSSLGRKGRIRGLIFGFPIFIKSTNASYIPYRDPEQDNRLQIDTIVLDFFELYEEQGSSTHVWKYLDQYIFTNNLNIYLIGYGLSNVMSNITSYYLMIFKTPFLLTTPILDLRLYDNSSFRADYKTGKQCISYSDGTVSRKRRMFLKDGPHTTHYMEDLNEKSIALNRHIALIYKTYLSLLEEGVISRIYRDHRLFLNTFSWSNRFISENDHSIYEILGKFVQTYSHPSEWESYYSKYLLNDLNTMNNIGRENEIDRFINHFGSTLSESSNNHCFIGYVSAIEFGSHVYFEVNSGLYKFKIRSLHYRDFQNAKLYDFYLLRREYVHHEGYITVSPWC